MNKSRFAVFFAFLAAALYALNSPISKLLLENVPPTMMASFLYLGAGAGMLLVSLFKKITHRRRSEMKLTKKDLPYTLGMIVLDILAPIFLMLGLSRTTPENASLLNNFEIVATSLIALVIFKEKISRRLWAAIGLIVLSSILISIEDARSFQFSAGSVFVLLACCCWGLENNCTRMLSQSDPQEVVIIKGFGSGAGSLIVALLVGERFPALMHILPHHIPEVLVIHQGLQAIIPRQHKRAVHGVHPFDGEFHGPAAVDDRRRRIDGEDLFRCHRHLGEGLKGGGGFKEGEVGHQQSIPSLIKSYILCFSLIFWHNQTKRIVRTLL